MCGMLRSINRDIKPRDTQVCPTLSTAYLTVCPSNAPHQTADSVTTLQLGYHCAACPGNSAV